MLPLCWMFFTFFRSLGGSFSHGSGCHHAGSGDDVIHCDVAAVLDVLHLLPVPWGLLQRLDDQGSSGGDNRAGGLPVLDLQLNSDLEPFPVGGRLGDVVTNLLWRQTQRTHLRSQRTGCSNFASYCPQVDILHLSGVEFGSHLKCWRDLELVDEVK